MSPREKVRPNSHWSPPASTRLTDARPPSNLPTSSIFLHCLLRGRPSDTSPPYLYTSVASTSSTEYSLLTAVYPASILTFSFATFQERLYLALPSCLRQVWTTLWTTCLISSMTLLTECSTAKTKHLAWSFSERCERRIASSPSIDCQSHLWWTRADWQSTHLQLSSPMI